MPLELRLTFSDAAHVAVSLLGEEPDYSHPAKFINPLEEADLKELRWYLEDYGTTYAAEPDDNRAAAVRDRLPVWGTALFEAALEGERKAAKLFDRFLDTAEEGCVLSIAADHPAVLSLPWELLHTPNGTFLCNENPPVSIRRGLPSAGQGRSPQPRDPKPGLHLLFIVSRPDGASFIDPRSDADAVLTALKDQKQQRAEVEFLRPPTLDALRRRLRDSRLPEVDIIHFDGHGAFGKEGGAATNRQQGWLLFEDKDGNEDRVSAEEFGKLLHQNHAGLVVLSACQSAAMDREDPMSGCAARLVNAGIPAVIAMTHSVLVSTAEQLFAEFYGSLFKGWPVARSLDEARHALLFNPERGTRLRGEGGREEITLELHDWFLPALYQSGADRPLLNAADTASPAARPEPLHNLPVAQVSGFFGRSRELWRIERVLSAEDCRRFSITGFGGQGKTALALEAGRWLLRTHLFERVYFISYAASQSSDPVGKAVAEMRVVFKENLVNDKALLTSLQLCPTLLILDNLETLADGPGLAELLDAAVPWSEAGESRVLLTSRQPDFIHPAYPVANDYAHQQLALQGLHERDAVDWFDSLRRLPPRTRLKRPRRDVLIRLFRQVGFHPLSISLLAQQLKEHAASDVGERLDALLEEQPPKRDDRSLLASLELSIERLPAQCREWLPRLGVFAGGCLEVLVEDVTGIKEADWQELRSHLLIAGLMQDERVLGSDTIFLRFHPTLAPALWQKLGREEQDKLTTSHWQAYYQLSNQLYNLDKTNPHAARALVRCELPNLLRAVYAALQSGSAEEGVRFADKVNHFLDYFGMQRDSEELTKATAKTDGMVGSQAWFVARSNLGKHLQQSGQPGAATKVFSDILAGLRETPSYNRCIALRMLGRCCAVQGQLAEAEQLYQQELAELALLKQSEVVQRQTGGAWTDLADLLADQGRYTEAKTGYQVALEIMKELGDTRSVAVVTSQLGTLAHRQGELAESVKQYKEALPLLQSIDEPATEAVFWYLLGKVCLDAEDWEASEQAYRQAARLMEEQGLLGGSNGAGSSWQQLAQVCTATGRPAEAEQWCRKALKAHRAADHQPGMARTLNNLAILLANDPSRLDEASGYAEESRDIKETLDPAAMQIWNTYDILADITTKQGNSSQAAKYHAQSRQAYFAFPGWRQQLWDHEELIAAVVQGGDVEAALAPYGEGWDNLKAAIRSLLNGERNEAALYEPLDYEDAAIIHAILKGIAGQG